MSHTRKGGRRDGPATSQLEVALRAARMGIWRLDILAGRHTYDAQVCRILDIDPDQFVGTAEEFFSKVHPQDRDRVQAVLQQSIERGTPYDLEYRAVWSDATVHDVASRGAITRDEAGRPIRLDGVLWAMSARKGSDEGDPPLPAGFETDAVPMALISLEGRLVRANDAFAKALRRSPSDLVGKPVAEELLRSDSRSGQGAECRVSARAEEVSPDLVPACLAGVHVLVVDDSPACREILAGELMASGMRPDEACDGPSALRLLHQAIVNGDPFQLVLTDMQMPGMDGQTLARILSRDKRFASTRLVLVTSTKRHENAGRLAEAGFAAFLAKPVRQKQLVDCLVQVITQTTPVQAVTETRNHSSPPVRRYNPRILLAEDDRAHRQAVLSILATWGIHADAVSNGCEVIKALERIPYDLVLMDVQMPEMDGFEATRAIRTGATGSMSRNVPIIAMTAPAVLGDRDPYRLAGMDDSIAKPVSTASLSQLLEKWLARLEAARRTTSPRVEPLFASRGFLLGPSAVGDSDGTIFAEKALLERLMGDRHLTKYIIDGFLGDIPRQLDRARAFLDAADAEGVERKAQAIAGAAATVGADSLARIAVRIELAGRAGELEIARTALDDLRSEFERASAAMRSSGVLDALEQEPQ